MVRSKGSHARASQKMGFAYDGAQRFDPHWSAFHCANCVTAGGLMVDSPTLMP